MPEAQRIKTKVCLVGEAAVGKTSLIRRFVQDEFDDRYITTLGAKVSKREMAFETPDRTKIHMDMTVWDIMGRKASGISSKKRSSTARKGSSRCATSRGTRRSRNSTTGCRASSTSST